MFLALLATVLLALGAAFQIGLAVGAPWGPAAYGGRAVSDDGTLPVRYRVGSAVAALVLLGEIWVALAAVGMLGRGPVSSSVLTVVLWLMVAFFALNTLGNAFAQHPLERWGAGTITAVLAVLCALIAVS